MDRPYLTTGLHRARHTPITWSHGVARHFPNDVTVSSLSQPARPRGKTSCIDVSKSGKNELPHLKELRPSLVELAALLEARKASGYHQHVDLCHDLHG